jgi:stage II sporulation protein D
LSPAEVVWNSRPRTWDRLLVGLAHLPEQIPITVKAEGPARLLEVPTGRLLASVRARAPVMLSPGAGDTVRFQITGASGSARVLRLDPGTAGLKVEGHRHAGTLLCWQAGERVACAIDTPLEAYLRGVVPGEVPAAWPLEAQKAMAVAARTYALASRGKHAADGFDVCDSTHCQMYLGRVPGAARSEQAVQATRGLVALSGGELIRAFYSADCGGRTANNEDVPFSDNPTEPVSYLRSVPDVPWLGGPQYCAHSPHHHWTRRLTAARIQRALNADPATAIGSLEELRISAVDASGRAKTVHLEGTMVPAPEAPGGTEGAPRSPAGEDRAATGPAGTGLIIPPQPSPEHPLPAEPQRVVRDLAGYAFRKAIGPLLLKSTRFTITPVASGQFKVVGTGYGHGIGLCQTGARAMAAAPYRRSFRQILAHYYRGVTIDRFHPTHDPP